MTIRDIRLNANMTQKEFAEYFGIPQRTIEGWDSGRRKPPEYLIELIKYKIEKERLGMFKLMEMDHGKREEIFQGTVSEVIQWLKNNKSIYTWILDEEPDMEMPDFDDVETLIELERELQKVSLGWWDLVIEDV